ncbi:MAG TPA: hypothetical protein VGQ12_04950 [Candidatus Angelobacter sp.]|jgi:acyl-CoA synthetase (AMP-forming)/AMP-acid ligase II|nr:hypothetical protein [Candidatus Angelobacter sp.]
MSAISFTAAGMVVRRSCRERPANLPDKAAFRFLVRREEEAASITFAELELKAKAIAARLQLANAAEKRAPAAHGPGLDFIPALYGCFFHDMELIGGVLQRVYGGFECIVMSRWHSLKAPSAGCGLFPARNPVRAETRIVLKKMVLLTTHAERNSEWKL